MPYRVISLVPAFAHRSLSDAYAIAPWPERGHAKDDLINYADTLQYHARNINWPEVIHSRDAMERLDIIRICSDLFIDESLLPKTQYLHIDEDSYVDFYDGSNTGISLYIISEKFRDLIEEFEPGVHLFMPVRLVNRKGNLMRSKYYYLINKNCTFTLDIYRSLELNRIAPPPVINRSFGPDRDGVEQAGIIQLTSLRNIKNPVTGKTHDIISVQIEYARSRERYSNPESNIELFPSLVLRSEKYKGQHLWRETTFGWAGCWEEGINLCSDWPVFMSDELFKAAIRRGLKGLGAGNRAIFDTEFDARYGNPEG